VTQVSIIFSASFPIDHFKEEILHKAILVLNLYINIILIMEYNFTLSLDELSFCLFHRLTLIMSIHDQFSY